MLGTRPIIEVARPDYDLDDINFEDKNKALSTDRNTPKIYQSMVIERPAEVSLYTDYTLTVAHNLGYIPRFWIMIKIWDKWSHAGDLRPNYNSDTFSYVTVDDTNFYITLQAYTQKLQIFCMFDEILATTELPITLKKIPAIRVSKDGYSTDTDHPRRMRLDSLWNTPRIIKSGQLSITAPEDLNSYGSYHEVTYTHNLNYIPFFLPRIPSLVNLSTIYNGFANIPSTVNLNVLTDATIANDDDIQSTEIIYVQADITELKISWWRENVWYPGDFPERTIILDYLLFELPLDEEFNLLLN